MNMDFFDHRPSRLLGLASAIALAAILSGPSLAGVDETLGGLPGTGGSDGWPGLRDPRPVFFVEGTLAETIHVVATIHGDGEEETVDLGGGIVRRIFHGDFELTLDEYYLNTTNVRMGVLTSSIAGGTKYRIMGEELRTPIFFVSEGGVIDLPFDRIERSGLLDDPAVLDTWNRLHGRSSFSLQRSAGFVHLLIRH